MPKLSAQPPLTPLIPWKWPSWPWSRLHIDFVGLCKDQMFLVVINAHFKWLEVRQITAQATIQRLRAIFAQFGLPQRLGWTIDQPLSTGSLRISCVRMGLSM